MKTLKDTARRPGKARALYALAGAAVIAGAGTFAVVQFAGSASATSPHRPSPSQALQSFAAQRDQYLKAHPLSSSRIAKRLKDIEQQATQQPPTPLPSGISQGTQGGPFSACEFKPQSEYISPPAAGTGTQVIAWAGEDMNLAPCTPKHGALYIQSAPGNSPIAQLVGVFDAPTAAPLKIVSVKGDVLSLRTLTGQQFTFNLASHKYSS
jgi:hypothetical protein